MTLEKQPVSDLLAEPRAGGPAARRLGVVGRRWC